jgi:hypothetical protein
MAGHVGNGCEELVKGVHDGPRHHGGSIGADRQLPQPPVIIDFSGGSTLTCSRFIPPVLPLEDA